MAEARDKAKVIEAVDKIVNAIEIAIRSGE
jgi:hypothetical protein